MNNKATKRVKKTRLDGQRKLDEALVEARKQFDREKQEAIEETVRKLQKDFDVRLKEEQYENKKLVEKLNKEWEDKITVCLFSSFFIFEKKCCLLSRSVKILTEIRLSCFWRRF